MEVKLSDLEILLKKLILHARQFDSEVKLKEDYYWNINAKSKFNFKEPNPDISIGSLYDDVECLKLVISNANEPTLLDLERLGNVLIYISEELLKHR